MGNGSILQQELFFELPGSAIRGIPIYSSSGKHLDFSLLEVGCRPKLKYAQLKEKRQLLYKYWGDNYRTKVEGKWNPGIYTLLAHYHHFPNYLLGKRPRNIDALVFYSSITRQMLADFNEEEKKLVCQAVRDEACKRILEEIVATQDAERLHRMITEERDPSPKTHLRGKLAEILVHKDLEKTIPAGMNLFRNEDVRYFNKRYPKGTEVDGVLVFYGEEKYIELLENLRKLEHLKVKDRWH